MAKKYRTGPGNIGRDLEPEEVDANFRDSDAREQEALDAVALRELLANKAVDFSVINDTKYPSVKAVSDFVGAALAGVVNLRGAYDASPNVFPSTGGSGVGGAVRKGDMWFVSVNGTLGGQAVTVGDAFFANVNTPGQTAGNWSIVQVNIVFVPENSANKSANFTSPDHVKFPSVQAVIDYIAAGILSFRPIDAAITTTAYTLALADANTLKECSNAAAQTITVPTNAAVAFVTGTEIELCRAGAGEVTIAAAGGVTILSSGNRMRIAEQHGSVVLKKTDTNTWRLIGGTKL